jgi:hypothetical protein
VVLFIRLSDPRVAPRVVQFLRKRAGAANVATGEFQVQPSSEFEGGVQQSIDVLTTGLLTFAIAAGLAGLVIAAIVLRRAADAFGRDLSTLQSLGISRGMRVFTVGLAAAPAALGGATLSVLGAFALSPVMPFGIARKAEPDLGLSVDGAVLGIGFVVIAVVAIALGVWSAHRVVSLSSSGRVERQGSSALARRAVAVGLSPPLTVGVAMTLEPGRGDRGIPTRTAGAAAVVGVLGVVAAVIFATNLDALPGTPRAYGSNWDAEAGIGAKALQRSAGPCSGLQTAVADDPAVAGVSEICTTTGEVNGRGVTIVGFAAVRGNVGPTVLEGRAPRSRDEVALGTDTFDQVHAALGDTVRLSAPERTRKLRVVGRVVLPVLAGTTDNQAIAEGATVTGPTLAALSGEDSSTPTIAFRWRAGVDVHAARARLRDLPEGVQVFPRGRIPLEVDRLEQVDALPWVLGGFLATVGCLGLAYALVTAVRRRARELATLKTLGFSRNQVASTVAVQATLLAGIGVLLGIPLGVLVGRLVWKEVAAAAGMLVVSTFPALAVFAIALATLVLANVVAGIPARRAAHLRPAAVLRSE